MRARKRKNTPDRILACGELYYQLDVVLLLGVAESCSVSLDLAALGTAVDYHVSALRVGLGADRLHLARTLVCAVAGIYVNVERPKAKRTVIARAVTQRKYLFFAVSAHK